MHVKSALSCACMSYICSSLYDHTNTRTNTSSSSPLLLAVRVSFGSRQSCAAQASSSGCPICSSTTQQQWRPRAGLCRFLPCSCCRSSAPASIPTALPTDASSCSSTTWPPSPRTPSTSSRSQVIRGFRLLSIWFRSDFFFFDRSGILFVAWILKSGSSGHVTRCGNAA